MGEAQGRQTIRIAAKRHKKAQKWITGGAKATEIRTRTVRPLNDPLSLVDSNLCAFCAFLRLFRFAFYLRALRPSAGSLGASKATLLFVFFYLVCGQCSSH